MKRTVLKMHHVTGTYKVIRDDSEKYNPYRIVRYWREFNAPGTPYGYRDRSKTLVKYGDLLSCMCTLKDIVQEHNME